MWRVIVRRLLLAVPLMVVVSLLVFALGSLTPGSVADAVLGVGATREAVTELNHELGFDRPMLVQYWEWLQHAVTGDLGTSIFDGRSVLSLLVARMPVTLSLAIGALIVVLILGTGVGALAAIRGGVIGRLVEVFSILVRGLPNFWLAMIAVLVFGVNLLWVPVSGYVPFADSPVDWFKSIVLPVAVLGLGEASLVALVTRAEMLTVMRSDFVRSLRANGYPWRRIVFKHIAKNAAAPVLTMVSLVFVGLLGSTILMEQIFGMAGLGTQMVTSATKHDLPVVQGLAVFYTGVVVVVFLLNDIAHAILNPKVVAR
jgi:peptide/nickel transport system permease protein